MTITILNKNAVKQSVEAMSGGTQTVLYTTKGQPSFVYKIPKMTMRQLCSLWTSDATHPAFIVNGVEKDFIYVGVYPGTVVNGELISIPNSGGTQVSLVSGWTAAKAAGSGWHCMTAVEYAMLTALSFRDGDGEPQGNTDGYQIFPGYSSYDPTQKGRRIDDLASVSGNGSGVIYGGSGPVSFRHNQDFSGISDLVGNYYTHAFGQRVIAGEIQTYNNNDISTLTTNQLTAALTSITYAAGSGWQAAGAAGAGYSSPTFTGTVGTDYTPTGDSIRLVAAVADVGNNGWAVNGGPFGFVNGPSSITTNIPTKSRIFAEAIGVMPAVRLSSLGTIKYSNQYGYASGNNFFGKAIGQPGMLGGTLTFSMANLMAKNSAFTRPVYFS